MLKNNCTIKIEPSSRSNELVDIIVDEDIWRSVNLKQFKFHFKTIEKCKSIEELEETFTAIEMKVAKSYCLYLLGLKMYLSAELDKKMRSKGICEKVSGETTDYLAELGYLDDKAYIESFVRSQVGKGLGKRMIEQKLKVKGACSYLYEQILEEFCDTDNMREQVERILNKKYRNKDLTDPKEKDKAIGYLIRRGFEYSIIGELLSDRGV